jgi:hypothetical protein
VLILEKAVTGLFFVSLLALALPDFILLASLELGE